MEHSKGIKIEVERILSDDALTRAPSQSRILKYLLERALSNNEPVTQYDIATEALSKPDSFDETTDSSVRVQVGRLRQSMEDYYRLNQPLQTLYAYIPSNEYRIRMARLELAYPDIHQQLEQNRAQEEAKRARSEPKMAAEVAHIPIESIPQPKTRARRSYLWIIAVSLMLVAIFGFNSKQVNVQAGATNAISPPKVSQSVVVAGNAQMQSRLSNLQNLASVRAQTILKKSMVSRAHSGTSKEKGDYRVQIAITEQGDGMLLTSVTLQNRNDRLLLAREIRSAGSVEAQEGIQDALIAIVSPAGVISNDLANSIDGEPRNGFECFILTEAYRSNGAKGIASILGSCLQKHGESAYYPYLATRDIFQRIQIKKARGERVGPDSTEWREVSELLSTSPRNAYANTMAAKLLIGDDSCPKAESFASEAFARGRTFPALELAVIVDAFACDGVTQYQDFWAQRIARITEANPNPHPLLESYMLIGLIVSDQRTLVDNLKPLSFATDESTQLENFNLAVRNILIGLGSSSDRLVVKSTLPALIWNEKTRADVENRLLGSLGE